MSSPLSFAGIAPPQLAPRQPSALDGLGELVLAIANHRDQLEQQAAQLDQERRRTDASVAQADAATRESKQDLADKKLAYDQRQKNIQAHDIVANELPGVLTQPGDFAQNAEAARVRLIQSNKQIAPYINDAFNAQLRAVTETRTAIAQRREAETNANVDEQTAPARIAAENLKPDIARSQLANSRIETRLHQMELGAFGNDQYQRSMNAFHVGMSIGLTAGQAADLAHIKLPATIPANYTVAPKNDNQGKMAADMAATMDAANAAIKASKSQAVGLPGLVSMTSGSTMMQYFATSVSDPEQQSLANNYLMYAQGLNHLANSARASDKDFARILRVVTTLAVEDPKVAAQKAIMRDLLPSVFNANAKGVAQSAALGNVINEARKRGVKADILAPFMSLRMQLQSAESGKDATGVSRDEQLLNETAGARP